MNRPETTMMPMPDTMPRLIARFLRLLACSCLTAAVLLGVIGCAAKEKPQEGTRHPQVTVVIAQKMIVPDVVKPIGTTRALNDVTIRARVKGFLEEKHFEDGKNVKKGAAPAGDRAATLSGPARAGRGAARGGQGIAREGEGLESEPGCQGPAGARSSPVEPRRDRGAPRAQLAGAQGRVSGRSTTRPKPSARRAQPRSKPTRPAWNRPRPTSGSTSPAPRRRSPQAQAAVDDAKLNLSYCKMYAPIDGRIGELKVKVGNLVGDTGATELVNIQQLDPMGLDLRPAARSPARRDRSFRRREGFRSTWPSRGNVRIPISARRSSSTTRSITQTSTFLVRAEVPNPDGSILPGQYIMAS